MSATDHTSWSADGDDAPARIALQPHLSGTANPALTVHLAGDLDLSTRDTASALLGQVQSLRVQSVVLDLSEVTFLDCVGLAVLLAARAGLGDRLRLRALSAPVARLLTLTGTLDRFVTIPDTGFAVQDEAAATSAAGAMPSAVVTAVPTAEAAAPDLPTMTGQVVAALGQITVDLPLRQLLQQVVDLAALALPEVDSLCLALALDGTSLQSAFVGSPAAALDERQYDPGFGPCLATATTGHPYDLDVALAGEEPRPGVSPAWHGFAAAARRHRVRAVTALPVTAGHRTVGALTLYATTGLVEPTTRAAAQTFAHHASGILANAVLHTAARQEAQQMREAMASREVIEQAKGVLMNQRRIDADAAFEWLSRTSQDTNIKLRVLARDVVDDAAGR